MAANNETGALQPIPELAARTHAHGALFHCDAAQAAGKIPLDVIGLGVDLLTVVGHKMYAPKGIAALWVRDGVRLEPVVYGGGQERGLRSGTRTPHSPSPSARRLNSPPTNSPTVPRPGSGRCATNCTPTSPTPCPAECTSTARICGDCRTR